MKLIKPLPLYGSLGIIPISMALPWAMFRLANGNTLIGWGQANTTLSEVTPRGNVVLEMTLPESDWTYRVYKFLFIFIKSPSKSEKLNAGSATFIKWNSSGVDSVDIDYSTDGGNTWNNIVKNYPGDFDSLMWTVPNTFLFIKLQNKNYRIGFIGFRQRVH